MFVIYAVIAVSKPTFDMFVLPLINISTNHWFRLQVCAAAVHVSMVAHVDLLGRTHTHADVGVGSKALGVISTQTLVLRVLVYTQVRVCRSLTP